ncbi:PREDICTED: protein S100-A9 [Capra hircus]|uniref:Protein S100-A9 n=1 Tax=Capra hircus TaxID=9925 RepID=A0A452EXE8_CAPHI|nr:PREDICTED: protein S100-A9 [Capra hircus]XP_017901621.1 PREDICTED: protein S100-A9 [Capra hircus]
MADQLSQMECSIETIINIFHQYSIRLRDPETLIQRELKQLVQKELPNFLKKQNKDEEAINEIMEDLDTNQDKQLSFEEFIMLVARLTVASHEEMHKTAPPGKGHRHGPGFDKGGAGPCPGQGGPDHSHGGHGHSHGGHGHSHGGHGHGHSH